MKVYLAAAFFLQALLLAPLSHADFEGDQKRWVDSLVSEDVSQIRAAAQDIHRARDFDEDLLDVVAEVILETYDEPPTGFIHADALSWSMNVLGASKNWRYYEVLDKVETGGGHKKLRKFAKKNRKALKKSDAAQYKPGTVSLSSLRR
ncbi:MAG: hypothetical protein AAGF46_03375 [Pseudomonadota bacterium]